MRFAAPTIATRTSIVLPFASAALVPAVLVLALVCTSLNRAEETVRLPVVIARPPAVHESPSISVRLFRQGALTIAGQAVADTARVAAWQRESAAVRLLGFEPARATVAVYADPDVPTAMIQHLIEQAQQAGFQKCVMRGGSE
jgi:biopolymer transport protein ExbD